MVVQMISWARDANFLILIPSTYYILVCAVTI